ncbi:hypothetical protein OG921_15635 [Aldersonia sp. NBC_00410]|uniref:hypothetical protein n=1 Tax=Aldersonia sp. NBC_00410 TaxID=2975954 RepID=UPI002252818F|nr:hypothetical protein [Aldersonia sp. NBC_00410]MCX5044602.1 hypothetical protein [Aldersonia sp. NBC_00410]
MTPDPNPETIAEHASHPGGPTTPARRGAMRLHPSLTVLLRRDGTVQLGWDPDTALLLRPPDTVPTPALLTLLRLLGGKHTRAEVVSHATELGIDPRVCAAILDELGGAGLIVPVVDRAGPSAVRVHGRGPLADLICAALAGSGVRLSRSADGHRAGIHDRRAEVRRWNCELVVLTDDLVADPPLVTALLDLRVPHLQVRIRDGRGVVGPLVLPGRTSCLRCADLTRCDYDRDWPHLAAQLLGRAGYARPAAVQATAAITLAELDVVLDGAPNVVPAILDATLELDLRTNQLRRRQWHRHRLCDCARSGAAARTVAGEPSLPIGRQ